MGFLKKIGFGSALGMLAALNFVSAEEVEILALDVIAYEAFVRHDEEAMQTLRKALHEKGIVGIRGVPGYKEKVLRYIESARAFSHLADEVKESYAPNLSLGEKFLGYEKGKEKFQRPDGRWVIDDLKVSYYAFVPENPQNKWPKEVDLQTPFQELGMLLSSIGEAVMYEIGLLGEKSGITLGNTPRVGRMLYYRKNSEDTMDNPFWCGAHFDHGMFTALVPAFYFVDGEQVAEPIDAGLFVKTTREGVFKKVVADDPEVMLFQVGEFGQLATNDAIRATEHRVHKAKAAVERYTLALFFSAPNDAVIHSTSILTKDARYGGSFGDPCSYGRWHEESYKRYIVKEKM